MYLQDYNCALCSEATSETITHLFWDCQFASMCWQSIIPNRLRGISFYDEIQLSLINLPEAIAMEILIMGCWSLWMSRNDKIFRMAIPTLDTWKYYFKEGLRVTEIRAKATKAEQIHSWIEQNL
jgi:hypothetical protein